MESPGQDLLPKGRVDPEWKSGLAEAHASETVMGKLDFAVAFASSEQPVAVPAVAVAEG
jgi:hypothetical protein